MVEAGAKPMTGISAATIGMTKNTNQSTSEVRQYDVYCCQKVGPAR